MGVCAQVYQQLRGCLLKHAAGTRLHIRVTRAGGHPNATNILKL
jgi:hypothetical protein